MNETIRHGLTSLLQSESQGLLLNLLLSSIGVLQQPERLNSNTSNSFSVFIPNDSVHRFSKADRAIHRPKHPSFS